MFHIEYNQVLEILSAMDRTLDDVNAVTEVFMAAVERYNAMMQDATAQEATVIVLSLRDEIEHMKELIEKSNKLVYEGASGLKRIEDYVDDGGLKV